MKVTIDARELELPEHIHGRIARVMEDYSIGGSQFIEESILRSLRFYEGLTQMFTEEPYE